MKAATENNYNWQGTAIRQGIIAGGTCVALFAGVYFLQREWVLSRGLWLGSGVIYLLAMWEAQKPVKSENIQAFIQPGFLVFVVANAIFYLYYYLLFAVFDPGLVDLQVQLLVAAGKDPAGASIPTIGGSFFSYVQSLIFGFVIAAITGAVLRHRQRK
jgi:hypothetical protein